MALGFDPAPHPTALPIVKFESGTGRFLRIDQEEHRRAFVDITAGFRALLDMENLQVGWMRFAHGVAPDLQLFPIGGVWPAAPSPSHRRGVRVMMQLDPAVGGGVRELCSTASGFLVAFDALHDDWLRSRGDYPGQLPIVSAVTTKGVQRTPPGTSQSCRPDLSITGWAARPAALPAAVLS